MHIYISQRALEEGVNAIIEEMVPFSYMMLREGYDAESIIQFLESAEDEDFDFIYEQADSEMLSESVVDEMSDEEVLLYEEQIELVINHFGLMEAKGAALNLVSRLATKLKAMTPEALKKFIKNNPAARSLARKLGLDKKAPVPKTGTPKPTVTPKSNTPKPKSSRTTDQKTQTASQPPKLQPPKSKTPTKTNPSGLGAIVKKNPGKLAGTTLGALGAGLVVPSLLGGGGDDSTTADADAEKERQKALDDALNNPDKDKPTSTPRPPRKDPTTGTPWWIARNQSLIGKRTEFRSDVALKRFRNPSAKANFTNIRSHYEYLVDYLIAEGHAETVEEATYVMQQMGEEAAVEILSEVI